MNNETPEAALRSRIADLEQQLKLSDEGCSRLAARCLDLEKEVQSYLAGPTPSARCTPIPPPFCSRCSTLMQASGFSERDTLTAPDYVCDELTGTRRQRPLRCPPPRRLLRFDPG